MDVPESMHPEALRSIADWLDCYEATIDKLVAVVAGSVPAGYASVIDEADVCPGNEMQDDLRWWADELEQAEAS